MANRKASAFAAISTLVDGSFLAMAELGTNYKVAMATVWAYIQTKIKGSAAAVADDGIIVLAANDYVFSLVATNAGGDTITFSVGTTAGGSQVLEDEEVEAGDTQVFVINFFTASAASLHFSLDTGALSIRIIKQ